MNQNSLQAYREVVLPTLGERQLEVFKEISRSQNGLTIYDTAQILGRFPNQISGRFSEICGDLGLIIIDADRVKKVGTRNHSIWVLTEKGEQLKQHLQIF